jgi:hypothetical protein
MAENSEPSDLPTSSGISKKNHRITITSGMLRMVLT